MDVNQSIIHRSVIKYNDIWKTFMVYKPQEIKNEEKRDGKWSEASDYNFSLRQKLSCNSTNCSWHLSPKIQRIQLVVEALRITSHNELEWNLSSLQRKLYGTNYGELLQEIWCNA